MYNLVRERKKNTFFNLLYEIMIATSMKNMLIFIALKELVSVSENNSCLAGLKKEKKTFLRKFSFDNSEVTMTVWFRLKAY